MFKIHENIFINQLCFLLLNIVFLIAIASYIALHIEKNYRPYSRYSLRLVRDLKKHEPPETIRHSRSLVPGYLRQDPCFKIPEEIFWEGVTYLYDFYPEPTEEFYKLQLKNSALWIDYLLRKPICQISPAREWRRIKYLKDSYCYFESYDIWFFPEGVSCGDPETPKDYFSEYWQHILFPMTFREIRLRKMQNEQKTMFDMYHYFAYEAWWKIYNTIPPIWEPLPDSPLGTILATKLRPPRTGPIRYCTYLPVCRLDCPKNPKCTRFDFY